MGSLDLVLPLEPVLKNITIYVSYSPLFMSSELKMCIIIYNPHATAGHTFKTKVQTVDVARNHGVHGGVAANLPVRLICIKSVSKNNFKFKSSYCPGTNHHIPTTHNTVVCINLL